MKTTPFISVFILLFLIAGTSLVAQPIKLQPGETATVTKRTVVTIKVPDTKDSVGSWRCRNIPDEAILALSHGNESASRADWDKKAGNFIVNYAKNCPSFEALEKEFPPWLNQKKYTEILQMLFKMNHVQKPESLIKIARENEVEDLELALQKDPKKKKEYKEKRQELKRKANAARILLELKFTDELKTRYEASQVVEHFMKDYLDKKGNVKSENITSLKKYLRELTPQQKLLVKGYLREVLARTEYPKAHLLPSRAEEAQAVKEKRSPASLMRKDASRKAAIQVMLFELE